MPTIMQSQSTFLKFNWASIPQTYDCPLKQVVGWGGGPSGLVCIKPQKTITKNIT